MRAVIFAVLFMLTPACARSTAPTAAIDAGSREVPDAGPLVTDAALSAWLSWQARLGAVVSDAGLQARARDELALLADAGLTLAQVDALEGVIAAVVAERSVARLTGADAVAQFQRALEQLSPEQRLKAEAALRELQGKTPRGNLEAVEAQFGHDAVQVVLTRESEVTKTWDALLEARGDKR